jgi:hypothetical protein
MVQLCGLSVKLAQVCGLWVWNWLRYLDCEYETGSGMWFVCVKLAQVCGLWAWNWLRYVSVRVWQNQDCDQSGGCYWQCLILRFRQLKVSYSTALPDTLIIAMKQCCMRQFNEQDIHCCHDDEKDPLNEDRQPEKHSYSQVPKCAWQNNVLRQGTGTVIMVGRSVERHICCRLHRTWHIPPTSKLET